MTTTTTRPILLIASLSVLLTACSSERDAALRVDHAAKSVAMAESGGDASGITPTAGTPMASPGAAVTAEPQAAGQRFRAAGTSGTSDALGASDESAATAVTASPLPRRLIRTGTISVEV